MVLARVSLLVSPSVGPVGESEIRELVLDSLGRGGQGRAMMSQWWKESATLKVERREPLPTGAAKVLPLHVRKDAPG